MSNHRFPVTIARFKPIEVIDFDPDKPIGYQNPLGTTTICNADDVVALGEQLMVAEYKAWEGLHASEIVEAVIDGAADTLIAVSKFLEQHESPQAKQHHYELMKLILRMKSPLLACVAESLGAIYLKGGMPAVRRTIEKLTKGERQ